MRGTAKRVASFGTTIFVEINELARRHKAVNLGQGAPDFDGPAEVLAAAVHAVNSALNQYAPGFGMASVREAIARHAERFYGQKLDPQSEVLVTSGATEGMFAAILGLTDPGDEVIVFEPVYDTYVPNLIMAGVTPRYVPLRGDQISGISIPMSWRNHSMHVLAQSSSIRRITPRERFIRPRSFTPSPTFA